MAQNLKDLAGRLPSGPRGMGTALKLLLGAGAVAYGVRESVFTGEHPAPASRHQPSLPDPHPAAPGPRAHPAPHPAPPEAGTYSTQRPVLTPTLSPQWKAGTEPSSLIGSGAYSRTPFWPRAFTSGNGGQSGLILTLHP